MGYSFIFIISTAVSLLSVFLIMCINVFGSNTKRIGI